MTDDDTIERRTTVQAGPRDVIAQLVDFRRWRDWSPWEGLDPQLQRTYGGPESGVGSTYEWSGNRRAGAGRMEITSVTDDAVHVDLAFTRPFKSANTVVFTVRPVTEGSEVIWTMRSPRTWQTRIFGVLMNLEKAIGKDLERGLANLKSRVEAG